jgi:hypothetical protein
MENKSNNIIENDKIAKSVVEFQVQDILAKKMQPLFYHSLLCCLICSPYRCKNKCLCRHLCLQRYGEGWQFLGEFHSSRNRGIEEWQFNILRGSRKVKSIPQGIEDFLRNENSCLFNFYALICSIKMEAAFFIYVTLFSQNASSIFIL